MAEKKKEPTKVKVLVYLKYDKTRYAPGEILEVRAEDLETMKEKEYIEVGE